MLFPYFFALSLGQIFLAGWRQSRAGSAVVFCEKPPVQPSIPLSDVADAYFYVR